MYAKFYYYIIKVSDGRDTYYKIGETKTNYKRPEALIKKYTALRNINAELLQFAELPQRNGKRINDKLIHKNLKEFDAVHPYLMKGMLNSEDGIHEFFDVHGKSSQEVCDYVNSIINTLAANDDNYKVKVALIDDIYLHYKPDEKHLVRYGMIKNLEKASGECIARCRYKKILLIGQFAPDWIATFALNNNVYIWHDSAEQIHNYEYDPIDESLTYVNEFKEIIDMDFDIIIANPPYDIGNKITRNIVENISFDKYINLMPLSCYKGGKLYRNVDNLEVVDPKLFEDAAITNNLCIAVVDKEEREVEWEEFEISSFDPKFEAYYRENLFRNKPYAILPNMSDVYDLNENIFGFNPETDFMMTSRTNNSGVPKGDSHDRRWNIYKEYEYALAYMIRFNSNIEKDNLVSWWYRRNLSQMIITGTHKSGGGRPYINIPNIDWSRTDVEYTDEYVLEQMGLKWNANKDGVERI